MLFSKILSLIESSKQFIEKQWKITFVNRKILNVIKTKSIRLIN